MFIELHVNPTPQEQAQIEARFSEYADQYERGVFSKCVDCLPAGDRKWFDMWWNSQMPDGFWDDVGVVAPPAYHAIMQVVSLGLG